MYLHEWAEDGAAGNYHLGLYANLSDAGVRVPGFLGMS